MAAPKSIKPQLLFDVKQAREPPMGCEVLLLFSSPFHKHVREKGNAKKCWGPRDEAGQSPTFPPKFLFRMLSCCKPPDDSDWAVVEVEMNVPRVRMCTPFRRAGAWTTI